MYLNYHHIFIIIGVDLKWIELDSNNKYVFKQPPHTDDHQRRPETDNTRPKQ